jgi:hypothetical protein
MPLEVERGLWGPDIDKAQLAPADLFCLEMSSVNGYDLR